MVLAATFSHLAVMHSVPPYAVVFSILLCHCGASPSDPSRAPSNQASAGSGSGSAAAGAPGSGGAGATSGGASATPGGGSSAVGGAAAGGGTANSGGSAGSATSAPEPPGIQYFGRWDLSSPPNASASWGDVYLKARFEGTSVTIQLSDPNNDFQYSIDGGAMQSLSPTSGTSYQLASGLSDGVHSLELYRRSGGSFGRTTVSGLVLDAGKNVLAPDPRPARKLEVLGDSISVGYGNENTAGMFGTSRATENGYMAYGPQLARMLGAEWRVVAHSGQGLYRNLGEDLSSIASTQHMPDEFQLTFFPDQQTNPSWQFEGWQPDVFIVTLGTNDFSWKQWNVDPGPSWEPTEEAYVGAYKEFLTFVRSAYPNVEVFAVGTFIATSSNQFGRCNQYICKAVTQMNDTHMHCVDPSSIGPDGAWLPSGTDYIGDWTHPTVAGHTKVAEHLKAIIQPIMGW